MSTMDDLNIKVTAVHDPRQGVAVLLEGIHTLLQDAIDLDDLDHLQTVVDDLLRDRASLMAAVFVDIHST